MAQSRIEIRVGIFVFVGLTALCTMIIMFSFKNFKVLHNTYRLTAVFSFTNGVVLGAPVRFAGVEVGKVDDIKFADDNTSNVYLHMSIRKGIVIRKDVRLIINSLGVLGETYPEFIPQSVTAEPFQDGDKVKGEEPIPLSDVVHEGLELISKFRRTFHEIMDPETKENMKQIVRNLKDITGDETQESLKTSLRNISELTGEETRKKLLSALNGFEEANFGVQKATSSLDSLIEENRKEISTILERWKTISESIQGITLNLNQPNGTLGMLIHTSALHDTLSQTLKNFSEWVTLVRKHGLLYKDKDVQSDKPETYGSRDNRGYLLKRK